MYKTVLKGLLWLNSVTLFFARDASNYNLGGSFRRNFRNPHQRYLDVYTNYPRTDEVLKSLDNYKGHKYVYPKSSLRPSYSNYYDNSKRNENSDGRIVHSRRRGYGLPDTEGDLIKFSSDLIPKSDILQSDYGEFDNSFDYISEWQNSQNSKNNNENRETSKNDTPSDEQKFFHIKGRPKFKTGKNYTEEDLSELLNHDYFTNIQKIPRYDELNQIKLLKDSISNKIHQMLKKYLGKLYKKVHGLSDDNKEEFLDASPEVEDNIETLDHSGHAFNGDNLYEVIDEEMHNKLNSTKGKFLDPTKLIILQNSTKLLANKFLSLFTIIKFPNTPCVGTNSIGSYDGTCYYQTECDNLNGTAMGTCANGYGVCCVFVGSCGGSSNQNCSYFQSPNYPNYYPSNGTVVPPPPPAGGNGTIDPRLRYQLMMYLARQESTTNSLTCVFQVAKSSSNVRQLRIDFLDLELRGPTNGTCVVERLIITGQNANDIIPALCGYNTGQHIYVDVTNVNGPITISVLATAVERKRFRIRVCQITACDVPLNCLQYYTGATGIISSFNYDQAASLSRSTPGYFNNLNYAICIRKEAGYCSVTYTNAFNSTTYPFQIVNIDDAGLSTVPPGQAGAEIFSCPDDYIVINGIRLCGERLNDGSTIQDFTRNAPVTDTSAGPIIVPFRTNNARTGRGFRLFYSQNRCPNMF